MDVKTISTIRFCEFEKSYQTLHNSEVREEPSRSVSRTVCVSSSVYLFMQNVPSDKSMWEFFIPVFTL